MVECLALLCWQGSKDFSEDNEVQVKFLHKMSAQ
jgi:hypothetical protein